MFTRLGWLALVAAAFGWKFSTHARKGITSNGQIPVDYTALWIGVSRDGAMDDLDRQVGLLPFPFRIVMPCGTVFSANSPAEVPRFSVPCPCGDPRHHLVGIHLATYRT
jgi:hypothetical protein